MPKNKFNSFYYGIGMKLDEASVDKAGQQLEGRLNQVVDQITQKVATMSDAIAKGAKDIDAKELVKSLVEAQQELNQFQNFDPSKLQKQIDALNATVTSLSDNLGEVGTQLKTFTDDVTSRLSNIEIKTSKQGKDSLKSDLKGMIELARGYRDVMAQGVDIDTSALDKYFVKVKQGFKSLQNSGNPMEMFSDKELAQYFVSFTKILQEMGTPVDKLREEFYSLSSAFKTAFEKSGSIGSNSVFKDIGYQIETVNVKLKQSQSKLASYKNQIQDLNRRRKSTGFDVTVESDKNLSFDQKIDKINEYDNVILESTQGSQEWYEATKKQIALIQAAEKELAQLSKGSNGAQYMKKWNDAFGVDFDLDNKFSQNVLSGYVEQAQKDLIKLGKIYSQAFLEVKSNNARLSELMAKDAATSSSKKTRQTVTSTQKQKVDGIVAEVDAKVTINQEEWRKAINAAMTQVEPKVKPFKIKVEATSGNILKEVRKIRDASLINQGKDGTSDVNAFNKRFDKFYKNLQKRREEIIAELKNNWHPALKDAFSFKFELLGIDKKSLTKNIDTYFVSMVDVINDALEQKPIEFHSNIDTLIEEIKSKVENLEIKGNVNLGAGNVGVSSNAGQIVYVLGGGIQGGAPITQPNIQPTPPSEPPAPTAPTQTNNKKQSKKTSKKEIETAEDHAKTAYEAGKDIIEYYIRLAKLGKNLSSIREIADKPITADMFDDENLTKWVRGKIYTKDDIGKAVAPGKKPTSEAIDKFLATMGITEADLAEANTQEEVEFLTPLKKYIYTFMQNRQELNSLIKELADGQSQSGQNIAKGYLNASNDTTKYIVEEVFDVVNKLYVEEPKTRAQRLVTNAFKNAHVDISPMSSMKTTEDKWDFLQSTLFNRRNYMLGSGDSAFATTWEDFVKIFSTSGLDADLEKLSVLLKIGRQYSTTFNSLGEVGKEADMLIRGRTKEVNKRVWNVETGRYEETDEKVSKVVEQGVRGMLKNLQAIFENKAGRTLLGYNLGKGYIPDDVFQSANGSYTQIIKVLTTALENSAQILFGRNMKGLEGNTSVGRYAPPTTHQTNEPYQFTTQRTEKEQISKWISEINSQKARLQAELSEINKQYSKLVKPEDKLRVAQLVTEIKTKQESFNQYNEKIIVERNKIDELKNSLTNPEVVYEDVVEKLLQAEENLIRLKKELATKKRNQKSGIYSKEIEDLQAKITAQENSIKSMTGSSKVASRSNSEEKANHIIAQEEEKLRNLNEELNTQRANLDIKKKQEEINRLKNEQAPLTKKVIALRNEVQQIQNTINNSDSKKATAEQSATIQSKNQEIDDIVQKTTALQQQIDTLQSEIGPHIIEKSFLLKEIEFRKKYVNALKEALKKRKKVRTQEEISSDIDKRTNELNKLQEEQSKVENDLQTLKAELGKFGSLQEVSSVLQKLQSIEENIARLDSQLSKHQKNLKNADNKKHIYSKTYYQAVNDLPRAQTEKETARANLMSLTNQYTSERTAVVTEALAQKKLGALSDNDAKKIQENLYNIIDLNKKLQDGTLTQEEYTQKVTDAYILMRKATTEEAKATAKADAEKLANAVLLVKKYQEEETILKRIIRTQKPKEPSNTQPSVHNNGNTSNKSEEPTQPVTGNTPIVTGTVGSGTVNGGIVLNAGGSGLAIEEKQNTIIELLRNGVKVIGGGKVSGDTDKQGGTKTPKIPSTVRADEKIQAIDKLSNVNKNSLLYKQYDSAKSNLESALSEAQSKGKDLTLQDTNKIKALINEVTKLGNKIINASNAFEQFKNNGGEAIDYTNKKVTSLEDEMLELAYKNASESNMLLSNVSYDKATQKMTYNLTDLEGTVTKVTMAYQDLFGIISKTSDKTTNSASKIYNTIEGEMTKRISVNDLIKNEQNLEKSKEYQVYLSAYDAMIVAQNNLREKGELATKSEKDELISLTKQVGNARTEFEKLADASEKFRAKIKNDDLYSLDKISPTFDIENQDAVEKAMKDFALSQDGLTEKQKKIILETWNFKNAQDGATYSVTKGKDQIVSMSIEMDKGSRTIGRYAVETKKYMSGFDKFMSSLKGKWQEVARYLMTFGSMYRVFAELQKGVQYVREIDSALTELKKVTDETEETYNRFLDTASKTASKVGSTIKEVVSSTADWARLGYSLEEAASLAESTSVLLNVSEFSSIEDATSALVSTMQAFGYAAKDSMHVVDVMNEIGNNYAISSDGIATALQDSASSLMAANNSYQEAVALIASANKVVQDPNSVGAALRTISLRLRGTSTTELEEAGEDATGVVTSKSKLRSKIKTLSGVDILTDTGAYKSTYQILLEISKVWEKMSDIDQAECCLYAQKCA